MAKSAGIIIIGDEILKGQTQDTNSHFLTKNLRTLGVKVERISVIPDEIPTIVDEVRKFSNKYNFVLTSGGIGPTHDDMTFEGIAKAFDDKTEFNDELVQKCKVWFKKEDLTDPCFKLACLPTTAKLNYGFDIASGKPMLYPLVSVQNVYIFPGIPQLLERAFKNLGPTLFKTDFSFITGESYIDQDDLTNKINDLVRLFPDTSFGSYPSLVNQFYKTRITYETTSQQQLESIQNHIKENMPLTPFDKCPEENSFDKVTAFMSSHQDETFKKNLQESLDIIAECFNKYSAEEVSICYNGGKDCIVMLHLVHAYFQANFGEKKMKSLYIKEKITYPEVELFIKESIIKYKLVNSTIMQSMKQALAEHLQQDSSIKATVLGTRMGDPGSQYQAAFSPTDGDWPKIMRVNPILNWRYEDVWMFLRGLSIPYPSLYDQGFYDQGYTSLGNPENTEPNPALRYTDKDGVARFHPAYKLTDGSLERQGRKSSK